MKKIFLFILLILGLGACVNPMDKYTESFKRLPELLKEKLDSAVALAEELGNDIESAAGLLERDPTTLSVEEAESVVETLGDVIDVLESEDFELALDQLQSDPETKQEVVDAINAQIEDINQALENPAVDPAVKDQFEIALASLNEILGIIN